MPHVHPKKDISWQANLTKGVDKAAQEIYTQIPGLQAGVGGFMHFCVFIRSR